MLFTNLASQLVIITVRIMKIRASGALYHWHLIMVQGEGHSGRQGTYVTHYETEKCLQQKLRHE